MDKVSGPPVSTTPFGLDNHCLAIGFSVRALAQGLREAGFSVIALDAFGDYDTRESAKVPQILTEWGALDPEKALQGVWPFDKVLQKPFQTDMFLPVFMAGGCENWPELSKFLSNLPGFKVLGPSSVQIQALRSPELWRAATQGTGIGFPPSLFNEVELDSVKRDKDWLLKSRTSGGGMGVFRTPHPASGNFHNSAHYLQAYIAGRSLGVTCIVAQNHSARPTVTFVGATESWQAADWPGPTPFIYRGSFGPVSLSPSQIESIEQVALTLVQSVDADCGGSQEARYRGWIQMDLIEDHQSRLWLLEVNPRWTAGMEVLRLSGLANPVRLHAQAFGLPCPNTPQTTTARQNDLQKELWVGKSIYYAPHPIPLTERLVRKLHQHCSDGFFDLPSSEAIGSQIEPGHPLLTIVVNLDRHSLSYEQARREALSQLEQKRQLLQEWIVEAE